MKNWIWKFIAFIASREHVANSLISLAKLQPYFHLAGYMNRWWLIPRSWRLPYVVRIHHILREDRDAYPHDHPGDWRTIVLRGWYIERDVFFNDMVRVVGDTASRHATEFHNIIEVSEGGVWTLFIMRQTHNDWGFMIVDNGIPKKVHWKDYASKNGRVDEINS